MRKWVVIHAFRIDQSYAGFNRFMFSTRLLLVKQGFINLDVRDYFEMVEAKAHVLKVRFALSLTRC